MPALDVAEVGCGMGPERFTVGEQEVEGAVRSDLRGQLAQGVGQLFDAGHAGMGLPQLLHDPAEGLFAVRVANGLEVGMKLGGEVLEIAVVREDPVASPEFAHEGVAVLQADHALGGLADMGYDVGALDRVFADELGDLGVDGAFVIDEVAQALVFEEGDAPAVGVVAGVACALREA
ncbi:hypothetical protein SDC9_159748 [bioreactor metagenome]|uniref:Uncharacterized protein n=1 Tax=bioreactor metagenome TaxID=1076179 RepID=A0A645FEN9_9ZZZZ